MKIKSFLLSILLGGPLACRTPGRAEAETKFAVLNGQSNFIKDIATQGKVDICLAVLGVPAAAYETEAARAEKVLRSEIGKWTAALNTLPNFPIKSPIPISIARQAPGVQCPEFWTAKGNGGYDRLSVHWYGDPQLAQDQICSTFGWTINQCASGADPWKKRMFYNPWNRGTAVQDWEVAPTILHEFGHALGLGDLYNSAVNVPAIMNMVWNQPNLTEDDKLGLAAATRFALTGERSCSGLGSVVMSSDGRPQIYCLPADYPTAMATLAAQHGQPGTVPGSQSDASGTIMVTQIPPAYLQKSFPMNLLYCKNDAGKERNYGINTGSGHQFWFTTWCGSFEASFKP